MSTLMKKDVPIILSDFPINLQNKMFRQNLVMGEILHQQGDDAKYLHWLISGQIRLVSFIDDQMVTYFFVDAGELIGASTLYIPTYEWTAIAETSTEIMAIPVEAFTKALKESQTLSMRYISNLTYRFYSVKALLEVRSIKSARTRLLHYLMNHLMPKQNTLTLDKPLHAIASELAITPEALSRILASLQTEGILTREKRKITFSSEWLEDLAYD